MLVDFNNLPDSARIWIYQSNKEFSENDLFEIRKEASEFVNSWTRHGDQLKGSFKLMYNHFIILAVDESIANASGCSIDSSVRFIKKMETQLGVDLTNKLNISFKYGETINIVNMSEFQTYAKEQKITSDTIVFNNMIQTKEELKSAWEVPAKDSWHQRFIK